MAEKQETVTDLIAWLRSPTEGENAYLTMWRDEIADRLEAAYKRDYEYPKAQSLDADKLTGKNISGLVADLRQIAKYHYARGYIVQGQFARVMADRLEAAYKREMSKNTSKNGADFGQLGDCAKLREALKECANMGEQIDYQLGSSDETVYAFRNERSLAHNISECARAALAAPPRNCDVGTAEEQDERFHRFCVKHHTGSCAGCHNPVGDYTVANGVRECALVWAQMPYEEGGAK